MDICEKCAVMRDGRIVAEFEITPETKQDEITGAVLGLPFVFANDGHTEGGFPKRMRKPPEVCPFFEVSNLCDRQKKFRNISFHVEAGEVVGLAGEGRAVIYASSDVSELLAVTDRIYVLNRGVVTGDFQTKDVDEQELLHRILEVSHDG